MNQSALVGSRAYRDMQCIRGLRRSLVLLHHCLNSALGVAARPFQIFFGTVHFILVFFLMRCGQDELIMQRVFFGAGRFGFLRRQPVNEVVIIVQGVF